MLSVIRRRETNTFHLNVGEMTVTLKDVTLLLGLEIDGEPIISLTYTSSNSVCEKYVGQALNQETCKEENSELGPRRVPLANNVVGFSKLNNQKRWWCYIPGVLLFYARGLHKGNKNLFRAFPRLLALWFNFGSKYLRSGSSQKDLEDVHKEALSVMRGCLRGLPPHHWLSMLPQLVSRICHQNVDVVRIVKDIITSVLIEYPQQGLWIMVAVSKFIVPLRHEAVVVIIQATHNGFNSGSNANSYLFNLIA
ncbi:hypothetical protein KIW84_021232 [Lathyrus oleraceus]|uniref:FAT domain-containing protein n=1 Tax=Pisum sativum TaxID=3888 RepID=A0A9D5B901_PEA|nr:hypothetical protein KIW84_021232 [Pisum sativum]